MYGLGYYDNCFQIGIAQHQLNSSTSSERVHQLINNGHRRRLTYDHIWQAYQEGYDQATHLGVELDEFMVELEICGPSIGCWLVSSQLSSSSSEYKLINPSPDIFSKACLSWPVLRTSPIQIFQRKYTSISNNFVITKIYSLPRPMCRIPYFTDTYHKF